MKKVGITGGIGAGKSIICRVFAHLGVPTYDADSRAKWVMSSDPILMDQIKKAFGNSSYKDGKIDRAFLANMVFNDESKRQQLNAIVHPRVALDFEQWSEAQHGHPYILKESALLIETKAYLQLDKLITVAAPDEIRIRRILQRDPHRDLQQIKAIFSKQLPEEEKQRIADFVIHNDEQQSVLDQVLSIHRSLGMG